MMWWKPKWVVVKIMMKYCYLKFLQTIYRTVVHLRKNHYEIQYILHDRVYRIHTQVRRGPSSIVRVLDHQDKDITEEIRSYMGPNEDFHGQSICPQDMGYEYVVFCFRNGKQTGFALQEPIVFR